MCYYASRRHLWWRSRAVRHRSTRCDDTYLSTTAQNKMHPLIGNTGRTQTSTSSFIKWRSSTCAKEQGRFNSILQHRTQSPVSVSSENGYKCMNHQPLCHLEFKREHKWSKHPDTLGSPQSFTGATKAAGFTVLVPMDFALSRACLLLTLQILPLLELLTELLLVFKSDLNARFLTQSSLPRSISGTSMCSETEQRSSNVVTSSAVENRFKFVDISLANSTYVCRDFCYHVVKRS